MSYPTALIPFHGDGIITLDTDGIQYVALKPIISALGLDLNTQYQKVKDSERYGHMPIPCQTPGGVQEMLCIPLKKLNGWLFSINPNKVRPDLKEKVIQYQEECFQVLHDYWRGCTVSQNPEPQTSFDRIDNDKLASLTRLDKELAWEYLDSLGIERPQVKQTSYRHKPYDLNDLAEALKPIAKEYDAKHFFVHVHELNGILRYQRRSTLKYLLDQGLVYPGEPSHNKNTQRIARKCNPVVAKQFFNGKRKRVYVMSWKLLGGMESVK